MTVKTRLTALIVATCIIVAGALGIIAWTLAAANITVSSTLLVTYTASPHVVGTVDATYQKTTDASATAFKSGTITMKYGDEGGSKNLNVSDDALILNDTNTYVVFEFKFYNNNAMADKGITISLTDNGLCSNMTRKYYFGDLSSKTISEKESTIKNSGIENSALSSTSVTIGQKETTYVYMLLEITPSYQASYTADDTNQFIFNLTSTEVTPSKKGSYLSSDWKSRFSESEAHDFISGTLFDLTPNTVEREILGAPGLGGYYVEITFTHDYSAVPEDYISNSISVGTVSETSTAAYTPMSGLQDVTLFWYFDSAGDSRFMSLVFYSPVTIYSPKNSSNLFDMSVLCDDYASGVTDGTILRDCDFTELDVSLVQTYTNFLGTPDSSMPGGYSYSNITYPANFPEEYK